MEEKKPFVSAVIVAAGSSTRMGANKMLLELGTKTVFERAVSAFDDCGAIDEIIIVASEENVAKYRDIVRASLFAKVTAIVKGGGNRQESVEIGMRECCKNAEIIVVHDGARPLIKSESIADVAQAACEHGAATAAVVSFDTLKYIDAQGFAVETINREKVARIQTPQAFRKEILFAAHEKAAADGFEGTDDCSLVEHMGGKSKVVFLKYTNLKLTVPDDIMIARSVLAFRGEK